MKGPRKHQALLQDLLRVKSLGDQFRIMAWVVAGGGKSRLPLIVAQRFPTYKLAWLVPRVLLRSQGAEVARDMGLDIWEQEENLPKPSRGTRGFITSHAMVTLMPELYLDEFRRHPYILCVDEVHHAKISRKGEPNSLAAFLEQAGGLVRIEFLMSGVMETNDDQFIYGVKYRETSSGWEARPEESVDEKGIYIRYSRIQALQEKAVVPIEFLHHDGPVEYISKGQTRKIVLSAADKKEQSNALFTALRTELAVELLRIGIAHWKQHGKQLIILAAYQQDARRYHEMLLAMGIESVLAISDEPKTAGPGVKLFRHNKARVLITCAMCYEGLDPYDATHLICLTHIRSVPWIEQALARIWRHRDGKSQCWAFVPKDPSMATVIDRIRAEEPSEIRAPGEGPGPPHEGQSVVAMKSELQVVHSEHLDRAAAQESAKSRAVEAIRLIGLDENHPLFEQMVAAQMERGRVDYSRDAVLATYTERAKAIRKEISDLCRRVDRERGAPEKTKWGTTQKELYRLTGVKFDTASLEDLERVARDATRYCQQFFAG